MDDTQEFFDLGVCEYGCREWLGFFDGLKDFEQCGLNVSLSNEVLEEAADAFDMFVDGAGFEGASFGGASGGQMVLPVSQCGTAHPIGGVDLLMDA